MFITPAFAQGAGGSVGFQPDIIFMMVAIFAIFYFLLIRPQQKKVKEHREMLTRVTRGDKVITGGGIIGTVTRVKEADELVVEIADGVKITVLRSTLTGVISRTEPAAASGNDNQPGGPTVVGPGEGKPGGLLGGLFGGIGKK